MKRRLAITVAIIAMVGLLTIGGLLVRRHSQAASAPLPTSLDVQGTNLTLEGPIQVPGGNFTVTFSFTPLNKNGSVILLSADRQMLAYKNDPSGSTGVLVIDENYSGPIYIQTYGASWHLTVR